MYAYVSGWNKSGDESGSFGLTVYRFDEQNVSLTEIQKTHGDTLFNVTYFDRSRNVLYALEEVGANPAFRSAGGGRIFAFKVSVDTGMLTKSDEKPTWSPNPCYLSTDETGRYLIVTHHGSYNAVTKIKRDVNGEFHPAIIYDDMVIELFELDKDGRIGKLLDIEKCEGDGPEKRQVHAHPHTIVRSPSGKLFAVCDKGNDTVSMYGIEEGNPASLKRPSYIFRHEPGSCPRYCAFHPVNKWFYHNSESNGYVYGFSYNEDGKLELTGSVNVLMDGQPMREKLFEQQGFVISPDGNNIYTVVRGPNVIAVLRVDQENGSLSLVQNKQINGLWPRGCAISSDGRYLFTACRDSGEIVIFEINEDGTLKDDMHIPNPNAAYITLCEI